MSFQEDIFSLASSCNETTKKNVVKVFNYIFWLLVVVGAWVCFSSVLGCGTSANLMPHFEGFSASGFGLLQYVVCFASFPGSHVPKHEH